MQDPKVAVAPGRVPKYESGVGRRRRLAWHSREQLQLFEAPSTPLPEISPIGMTVSKAPIRSATLESCGFTFQVAARKRDPSSEDDESLPKRRRLVKGRAPGTSDGRST